MLIIIFWVFLGMENFLNVPFFPELMDINISVSKIGVEALI